MKIASTRWWIKVHERFELQQVSQYKSDKITFQSACKELLTRYCYKFHSDRVKDDATVAKIASLPRFHSNTKSALQNSKLHQTRRTTNAMD